jgi:hypothetical protein
MDSKTIIGIYGHDCPCFDYVQLNLPKLINSQQTRLARYSCDETVQQCDIYVVSMQLDNAVNIIKAIREENQDAIIVACCCDHDIETLKQVVKYRVDSVCTFEGIDAVEEILSSLERKIKENNLQNQLRLQLKKAESALAQVKMVKRDLDEPDLAGTESMRLVSLA